MSAPLPRNCRHALLLVLLGLAIAPLLPGSELRAQQGRIAYEYVVKNNFSLGEAEMSSQLQALVDRMREQVGEAQVSSTLLLFNPSGSVMLPVPDEDEDEEGASRIGPGFRRFEVADMNPAMMMEMMNLAQSMPRPTIRGAARRGESLHTYTDLGTGAVVELREFLGRKFKVSSERPELQWRVESDQKDYLGYMVQKATAQRDSSLIEAWFTPQIPVSGGPATYGGLPGMILMVSVDEGQTVYAATEVDLTEADDSEVIAPPEEGQELTQEEYDKLVEERLEEMMNMRRGGIRFRRPPGL